MTVGEFCRTDVAVVDRNSTVVDVARQMRGLHVGDVVVCEPDNGISKPIGIITDRDIVVGVIALEIPMEVIRVEDVMTPSLVTVNRNAGVYETVQLMETYGARRLPVVDNDGSLYGIVSSADLLEVIGEELSALARLPAKQRLKEQKIRL